MLEKKEAILGLVKAIEGTMDAAGLSVVKEDGEIVSASGDNLVVSYEGDNGDVKFVFSGITVETSAKKDDHNFESIGTNLFEPESETWNAKDTKSAANEIMETIGAFFNTPVVYDAEGAKNNGKVSSKKAVQEAQPQQPKKKKAKKPEDRFEAINLAYRMENIFPELKGLADENYDKYGEFLPEEYFEQYATEKIIDCIRRNDKPQLKKIFKTFNTFYDEGSKDIQSLITVSILGMNMAKDEVIEKNVEGWLDENVAGTLANIVTYLKKGSTKSKINKFLNPTPYKETRKDRRQKQISANVDLGAVMANNQREQDKFNK